MRLLHWHAKNAAGPEYSAAVPMTSNLGAIATCWQPRLALDWMPDHELDAPFNPDWGLPA
jgi:hypothetical protein